MDEANHVTHDMWFRTHSLALGWQGMPGRVCPAFRS